MADLCARTRFLGVTPLHVARAAVRSVWPKATADARRPAIAEEMTRLLQLALRPWCPAAHRVFPRTFRLAVNIVVRVCYVLQSQSRRNQPARRRQLLRRRLRRLRRRRTGNADADADADDGDGVSSATTLLRCSPPLEFWLQVMAFCDRDAWSASDMPDDDRWLV